MSGLFLEQAHQPWEIFIGIAETQLGFARFIALPEQREITQLFTGFLASRFFRHLAKHIHRQITAHKIADNLTQLCRIGRFTCKTSQKGKILPLFLQKARQHKRFAVIAQARTCEAAHLAEKAMGQAAKRKDFRHHQPPPIEMLQIAAFSIQLNLFGDQKKCAPGKALFCELCKFRQTEV